MLAVLQKSVIHLTDLYIDTSEDTSETTAVAVTNIFDPQDQPQ